MEGFFVRRRHGFWDKRVAVSPACQQVDATFLQFSCPRPADRADGQQCAQGYASAATDRMGRSPQADAIEGLHGRGAVGRARND